MNILLVGSGAREHALGRALKKTPQKLNLCCFASSRNPGLLELASAYEVGKITDPRAILEFAQKNNVGLAIIGPEAPLSAGVADILWASNIPCVGPKQKLAQLETSKGFTRDLLAEYQVPGSPKYKKFDSLAGVKEYLEELGELYVVKADGLMGGKGVKVAGDHLQNHAEAIIYCQEIIEAGSKFIIEEKLIGQEFSLMSFCDGVHLAHLPTVQDHKRVFDGDKGPNTGGMGSYSDADHKLPFLTSDDIKQAQEINQKTANALRAKFGEGYKGVLYGGFMVTGGGVHPVKSPEGRPPTAEFNRVKLIEYNARLGDPEAMNVLSVLTSDLVELCQALVKGELTQQHAKFAPQATVCKYAVPKGYPDNPVKNQKIDISEVADKSRLYYASVDAGSDGLFETGSRAVAVVGVAPTIYEAEKIAEEEINKIKGPLFHRKDIGTKTLIDKRVEMMNNLRQ